MTTRKFYCKHGYAALREVYTTNSHDAAQRYATNNRVRNALVTVWTSNKAVQTSYMVRPDGIVGGI